MHVVMVNHYAVTPEESGGTRHYMLARELVRLGHRVTVLASGTHYQGDNKVGFEVGETAKLQEIDGVRFIRLRTGGNQTGQVGRLWAMLDFSRRVLLGAARSFISDADVIYGSSPHPFAAFAAFRLAKRMGVPFVMEVRDLWPESIIELAKVPRYHPLVLVMGALERLLYRRANAVVTLLPGSVAHIESVGQRAGGVHVVPNMVDLSVYGGRMPAPPLASESFTVLYAGAHGLANGLHTLLDAAAKAKNDPRFARLRFRLIGAGPEKPALKERARAKALSNVRFDDPVSKRDVVAELAKADAFYMPLKNSPVFKRGISPNKLFDYMAAARPVLFAVATEANPISASGGGVTLPPEDPEALLESIERLMALSPQERAAMGERAHAYVLERHSPEAMAERLLSVLMKAQA